MYTVKTKKSSSAKVGLNENAHVTSVELKQSKNGNNYLQAVVLVEDTPFNIFIWEVDKKKSYYHNGELVKPGDKSYNEAISRQEYLTSKTLIHLVTALGVTEGQLETLADKEYKNFKEFVSDLIRLIPKDYAKRSVDVFLEYEAKIRPNNDRTWLQIPRDMRYGEFIVPHIEAKGSWQLKASPLSWVYQDDEGNTHFFKRDSKWIKRHSEPQFVDKSEEENMMISDNAEEGKQLKEDTSDLPFWD